MGIDLLRRGLVERNFWSLGDSSAIHGPGTVSHLFWFKVVRFSSCLFEPACNLPFCKVVKVVGLQVHECVSYSELEKSSFG